MNELLLKYWVALCAVLAVKMWINSAIQASVRFRSRKYVNPEDANVIGAFLGEALTVAEREHDTVIRAARCWQNDLENIPLFLILALGFVLVNGPTEAGAI